MSANQRRIERHYRATLQDGELAASWARHYLGGLPLEAGAQVLDYGCGRGRGTALLLQRGFAVTALDIQPHEWWQRLPAARFVVVEPGSLRTPFADASFDAVLNMDSTHYYSEARLEAHGGEVHRLLKPEGHWVVMQVNPEAYGAEHVQVAPPGRLHDVHRFRAQAARAGFSEVDHWYEGMASALAPRWFMRLRHLIAPYPLYMYDYGSLLERIVPPPRRHRWVLRLRKKGAA